MYIDVRWHSHHGEDMNGTLQVLSKLAFVLLLMCSFTPTVHGQGTMGQVPDPMRGSELSDYLGRYVQPTQEQWVVIEEELEGYQDRFQALRDGPITKFLEQAQELNNHGGMPDVALVKKYMQTQERLFTRIRGLDESYFNSIAVALRPEQLPGLERVRLARERSRAMTGIVAQIGMGPSLDLWTECDRLELDEEAYIGFVAWMKDYDEKLTKSFNKAAEAGSSILLIMMEELEARDFGEIDFNDPEAMTPELMQEIMNAYMAAYTKAMLQTGSVSSAIRELNRKTLSDMTHVIDPWKSRSVKEGYLQSSFTMRMMPQIAYDEVTSPWVGSMDAFARGVIEREELLGAIRRDILDLLNAFLLEDHAQLDRMLKLAVEYDPVVEQFAQIQQSMDETGEVIVTRETIDGRMTEIQLERISSETEVIEQLLALIDSKGSPALKEAVGDPRSFLRDDFMPVEVDADAVRAEGEVVVANAVAVTAMHGVELRGLTPEAIDIRFLRKVRDRLDEDAVALAVVESLHEKYLEEWNRRIPPLVKELQEIEQSFHAMNPLNDDQAGDHERLGRQFQIQRELPVEATAVDEVFFADLMLAVPEEYHGPLKSLLYERSCEHVLLGSSNIAGSPTGGAPLGVANMVAVLNDLEMSPGERRSTDQGIASNATSLIDALRALQLESIQNEFELMSLQLKFRNLQAKQPVEDGADWNEASREYQALWMNTQNRLAPVMEDAGRQRDALLEAVTGQFSEDTSARFDQSMAMAANPGIYRDPASVRPALDRALGFSDLTPEQKDAITELSEEYDATWLECSNAMAAASMHSSSINLNDTAAQQDWMEASMRLERASFSRDEANGRALRRLARILGPQQRKRILALRAIEDDLGTPGPRVEAETITVE